MYGNFYPNGGHILLLCYKAIWTVLQIIRCLHLLCDVKARHSA